MTSSNTIIELFRDDMKFSAAHFTIFSRTRREHLHGHNFYVYAAISAPVGDNELAFDYTLCRKEILNLCRVLNEQVLVPAHSPYLSVDNLDSSYQLKFDKDQFVLPYDDVVLLPVKNISTEGLAQWFVKEMGLNKSLYGLENAYELTIKVSTALGQYASATLPLKEEDYD